MAIIILQFVDLLIDYYGGRANLLTAIADEKIKLARPPCCCCCVCLPILEPTR